MFFTEAKFMASNRKPDNRDKKSKNNLWITLIITAAVILIISLVYNSIMHSLQTEVDFNAFLSEMEKGNLHEVELQNDRIVYMTKDDKDKPATQQKIYYTGLPSGGDSMELASQLALSVKASL